MSDEVFKIELAPDVIDLGGSDETIYLEPILNNFLDQGVRELSFCMPARVVNVQKQDQLLVDVQPLHKIRNADNTITELPQISNVPMFFLGTDDTAVLFPVKQGQTVLLMFSQLSLDEFKGGSIKPYSAMSNRKHSLDDAIAFPSIAPFNRSPNRSIRHFTDHSVEDLTLVHNLGTSRENKLVLKRSGAISVISTKTVTIDAPESKFLGTLHTTGNVSTDADVIIQGRSLLTYMDTHNHNYTDNGSVLVTAVANPI